MQISGSTMLSGRLRKGCVRILGFAKREKLAGRSEK